MESSAGSGVQALLCVAFDGGSGTCVHARENAAAFLATLAPARRDEAVGEVLLVVSELVTNAVRHAPGPVVLALNAGTGIVRITVRDTSTARPAPRTPDLVGGTGGFGWTTIIQRLATDIRVVPYPGGKEIHAVLPW
ncbi:hypothetical protein GCM10010495_79080 [Kitasatospora herbaricolor]|uniref:ATP-binding protein n=1 Tax=Kitasatospora herbaricolor TaxID=68217 RepID=UPI0019B4CE83|nr:ATP-binding protein [Kitasatospora herbaricolor]MDQ0306179.1 anti-sigma regulatory factor (Ser/Thr protein kinase) [Kitasatospora herbaricolor]GGV49491.1 hypothetical protein GCM10010495_79080 [Kitasatospora herbaricolor]